MKPVSHGDYNSLSPISRHSLLTALWAMCVHVLCACVCIHSVCYGAFCSVVVRGLAGGTGLGVRNRASQPSTENVLPALSNIFSNTLHSFLTRTTTSAQTTLFSSPPLTHAVPQVAHKHPTVPLGLHLCVKILQCTFVASCVSSG